MNLDERSAIIDRLESTHQGKPIDRYNILEWLALAVTMYRQQGDEHGERVTRELSNTFFWIRDNDLDDLVAVMEMKNR